MHVPGYGISLIFSLSVSAHRSIAGKGAVDTTKQTTQHQPFLGGILYDEFNM